MLLHVEFLDRVLKLKTSSVPVTSSHFIVIVLFTIIIIIIIDDDGDNYCDDNSA